jgi:hypothetical protein
MRPHRSLKRLRSFRAKSQGSVNAIGEISPMAFLCLKSAP